jgi:membrane protein
VLLFGMLYRVVPNLHLSLRHVLPGALVAGVALEILTYLLPLYLRINQGINAYGRTFALIFFLLFFFFLLGTITMVGAEINAVILERSQPSRRGGDLGDHGDQGPPGH